MYFINLFYLVQYRQNTIVICSQYKINELLHIIITFGGNSVCILRLQAISVQTSHISSGYLSHVAGGWGRVV